MGIENSAFQVKKAKLRMRVVKVTILRPKSSRCGRKSLPGLIVMMRPAALFFMLEFVVGLVSGVKISRALGA